MKIINVEQGSPEWLAWRRTVITATDASAIMGKHPWVTPYKCWQRKLGLAEEQASTAAMEKGKRLEAPARAQFNKDMGLNMIPIVVESDICSFHGASLDGYDPDTNELLEIKCGGIELHNMAMHGIIPEYYLDQVQKQLLVTGAKRAYYSSYFEGNRVDIVVEPSQEWNDKYIPKSIEFWKCIANFDPPTLCAKDYVDRNDSPIWTITSNRYQEKVMALKGLEDEVKMLRDELISQCDDHSSQGNGLKVIKIITKGRVDYEKIPEIQNLDLNTYRKKSSVSWKILNDHK